MIRQFMFTIQPKHLPTSFSPDGLHICDITHEVENCLRESKIKNGIAIIESLHTTLGLAVNENEPGLMAHDFPDMLRRIAPEAGGGYSYEHDDFDARTENLDPNEPERENGHSHCRAILLPSSITRTIENGTLSLGRWQRILLIELDGHGRKNRKLKFMFMGE